ncbi:glycosyltransferase family 2 protein [Actinoplanes oblitus]|uniref:Glycosyltransferase family 2 protein n=1 Tax=Actinoplanes oblitus TaxID=3040509 RepID=A0ABY8WBE9_9ACTN|nr:glycosyltransferase family 2 protein [Actinoplanes oblitus]WIM94988.1 glycosyltransferase family 2 protein [Actinoplanes oblitus]
MSLLTSGPDQDTLVEAAPRRADRHHAARPARPASLATRQWLVSIFVVVVLAAVTVLVLEQTSDLAMIGYWCLGAFIVAACVVAFSKGRRYLHLPPAPGRVLCIVPAYNEDPEGLRKTVLALLRQTVPVRIVVIDDGSQVPVVPSVDDPRVEWRRQENTGKRGAQVSVLRSFNRDDFTFVLTVDSDSEPHPDACEQLLRAMSDPRVQAATGMIYIRNHTSSWVSMAADMDIGTSCVMMRASRSMLGALETTSGALALYRSELLYDHLDAYAVECGTGDDRWLALRGLRRGQVVAVAEALVETDMPDTLRGTYKQRLRWARSWWWMLPYVFKYLDGRQLLSPLYGILQLLITPLMTLYIVLATVTSFGTRYASHPVTLLAYVCAYVVVRYSLAALYLMGRPGLSRKERTRLFFLGTPAAILLNVILLLPTRYLALGKLFDNRWQTRELPPAR